MGEDVSVLRSCYGENGGASQEGGMRKLLILLCFVCNMGWMFRCYAVLPKSIYLALGKGGRFRANFFVFSQLTVSLAVCQPCTFPKQRYT